MANSRECSCSTPAVMIPLVLLASLYNSHQLTAPRPPPHLPPNVSLSHTHARATRAAPCYTQAHTQTHRHAPVSCNIYSNCHLFSKFRQVIVASAGVPSLILIAYAVKPENNFITTFFFFGPTPFLFRRDVICSEAQRLVATNGTLWQALRSKLKISEDYLATFVANQICFIPFHHFQFL